MKALNKGFTLIEMAIVIVVIGLVVGGGISIVAPIANGARVTATSENMDLVEKALLSYVVINGCLPCPANGSLGASQANAGQALDDSGAPYTGCTSDDCWAATAANAQNAVVPWKTLAISPFDAADAWGNQLRYRVGGCAAGATDPATCAPVVTVTDTDGMVRTPPSSYPEGNLIIDILDDDNDNDINSDIASAVYVLISSGPDRSMALPAGVGGAATGNKYGQDDDDGQYLNAGQNTGLLTTFVQGDVDDSNGRNHFDDIVRFKTAPLLVQLCGTNACGNPA